MNFVKHSNLEGKHAFLSASKNSWINYDTEKLTTVYKNHLAKTRGTILHAFAAQCITLKQKLPRSSKTLNMYVNDCIGFRMSPEVVLFYSDYCFGTSDAIAFDGHVLRISDYKSGETEAHMEQLYVYAALFCLEYKHEPSEIEIELRIYQSNECRFEVADPMKVKSIMQTIVRHDRVLNRIDKEEGALF